MKLTFSSSAAFSLAMALVVAGGGTAAQAQPVVPGTGQRVIEVGDDFEDANWNYVPNLPKSSNNIDDQTRHPLGGSTNGRWFESALRGQPDVIQRVPTPAGGLKGSEGALMLRTLHTGVPGRLSNEMQQDDLILRGSSQIGHYISVSQVPSFVVRVYLPPFEQWEKRTGSTLGIRADLQHTKITEKKRLFGKATSKEVESYWPGMFIQFNSKSDGRNTEDSAIILVRANENGHDLPGPRITQTGWWTFGMSVTGDGRCHYYAKPGVADLTAADHIASTLPYGYRGERFNTFFFNVVNQDNGRNWSTEWIIDDPSFYLVRR